MKYFGLPLHENDIMILILRRLKAVQPSSQGLKLVRRILYYRTKTLD